MRPTKPWPPPPEGFTFVRRSLRPTPTSRFSAFFDAAADVVLVVLVVVLLVGGLLMRACG